MKGKKNPFHQRPQESISVVKYPLRLNKFIAKSGVCSRRKAADLVKQGLISVNGQVVTEPFVLVSENDQVKYQGKILRPESRLIYLLINKPRGVITTTSDERHRKTVLDLVEISGQERLFPVGRLDRETTGLLLITNDGDLAKRLSHPSYQVRKEYLVSLDRDLHPKDFRKIEAGLNLPDGPAPIKELRFPDPSDRRVLIITLFIGRNRIVRRIFEHCGYQVLKLDRVYLAGLTKKNLPRGRYRHLQPHEIIMLKHFI